MAEEQMFYANRPPVIDRARVEHMRGLEDGWDSYGAKAPTEDALRRLDGLCLCPTNDGGWQVSYGDGKTSVEFEVDGEGFIEAVIWAKED